MTTTTATTSQTQQFTHHVLRLSSPPPTPPTPEERALALFKKIRESHNLSPEMTNLLADFEEEFLSHKTLILAKLFVEILIPLKLKNMEEEVKKILNGLLPEETNVDDYIARYKKVRLTLKIAEAKQTAFAKKTQDFVQNIDQDRAAFLEKEHLRKEKTIQLHHNKTAFHVSAIKTTEEKTAQVESLQQKTQAASHEVKSLNARISAHDRNLASQLQKFHKKGADS
jgi:hypothetical protein